MGIDQRLLQQRLFPQLVDDNVDVRVLGSTDRPIEVCGPVEVPLFWRFQDQAQSSPLEAKTSLSYHVSLPPTVQHYATNRQLSAELDTENGVLGFFSYALRGKTPQAQVG